MDQEKIKKNLEEKREKILRELEELTKPPEFGTDNYDDETFESQEFANQLSQAQALKDRLGEIDSAILKIGSGKYGLCENCGNKISDDVLEVVPESRLCKECKMRVARE